MSRRLVRPIHLRPLSVLGLLRPLRPLCLCGLAAACAPEPEPDATADLTPLADSVVAGQVDFTLLPGGEVQIAGEITGLAPGPHGMHIHEWGDCSSPEASGDHFNPDGVAHGPPDAAEHHAGDFGNIEADGDGRAVFSLTMDTATFALVGKYGVIGRALVVHEKADDFGQPTGNAGARLACGLIERTRGDTTPVLPPTGP